MRFSWAREKGISMTKKLMLLAAGALAALAFAALPAGASATEFEAHCSAVPCEGVVQSTGNAILAEDSGTTITCTTTTGTVKQGVATSSTVNVELTFEGCSLECQNEGPGTKQIKMEPVPVVGHLITVTTGNPATAGILLTNLDTHFTCIILGFAVTKTVTGNIIGTFTNPNCGVAKTSHTISFTQTGAGQQTDKTWTGKTFDLLSNGTTASQTGEAHINYAGGKTVNLTC